MLGAQDREIIQTPLPSGCSLHKGGKSTVSGVVKGPMTRTHVSGKVFREGQWCRWENLGKGSQ